MILPPAYTYVDGVGVTRCNVCLQKVPCTCVHPPMRSVTISPAIVQAARRELKAAIRRLVPLENPNGLGDPSERLELLREGLRLLDHAKATLEAM